MPPGVTMGHMRTFALVAWTLLIIHGKMNMSRANRRRLAQSNISILTTENAIVRTAYFSGILSVDTLKDRFALDKRAVCLGGVPVSGGRCAG